MDLVIKCITEKYSTFSGRARRKEYWLYTLCVIIASIIVILIDIAIGTYSIEAGLGLLNTILALGLFIPSLAVLVRRLHDINESGWWFFIALIPVVGAIWLIVLLCLKGTESENRFGPEPSLE